jgi:hypothetical protein
MPNKKIITRKDSHDVIEYVRGYNQGVKEEREIIIELIKTEGMRCKGHGEQCVWNNAIDFVIKKLSAKDD